MVVAMLTNRSLSDVSKVPLSGRLSEFCQALYDEIAKIEASGQSSIVLSSGCKIESPHGSFWYRFTTSFVPAIPPDTPCKLIIGKDTYDVTVISFDESSIIISCSFPLPDSLGKAQLDSGATILMERLINCIATNADQSNPAGERMLSSPPSGSTQIYSYSDLEFPNYTTHAQNEAIKKSLLNDITYIWGPPGTGKTTVIGQIIKELYCRNRSVLIVSHTNTAVDGAIAKADSLLSEKISYSLSNPCPILRLGNAGTRLPEYVKLSSHIKALGKGLFEKKQSLENRQIEIYQELTNIRKNLAKIEWLETNRIADLKLTQSFVFQVQKHIDFYLNEEKSLCSALNDIKQQNPEYSAYNSLKADLSSVKNEISSLESTLSFYQKFEQDYPVKISEMNAELQKHQRHRDLLIYKSKIPPINTIHNQISLYTSSVESNEKSIQKLKADSADAQKIIDLYASKGTLGKFFAKSTYEQAQTKLAQIHKELQVQNSFLNENRKHLVSQEKLLEKSYLLDSEIKKNIPTHTEVYWRKQLDQLSALRKEHQTALPELENKLKTQQSRYASLQLKAESCKLAFDKVHAVSEDLKSTRYALQENTKILQEQSEIMQNLLKEEHLHCTSFYLDYAAEPFEKANLSLLELLLEKVAEDTKNLSATALHSTNKNLHSELERIDSELKQLSEEALQLEQKVIGNANIVGSTLTTTYLNENLRARRFDTVILDEASMASIPALWCAGFLAEKNIVIVGDFLQLPPIVLSNTEMAQKWLGKDVFYHSGMQELAKHNKPANFVMLNEQFRMESKIADIANMYYGEYGGLLSDDNAASRKEARKEFYKWFPSNFGFDPIQLIDTESLHAWVTGVPQGNGHSRLNCFTAAVDVDLAFKFIENILNTLDKSTATPTTNPAVIIVAPYKPHIEHIKALLDLEYKNRGFSENLNYIQAGTIHSFQGSEADIVIFDLVIDEPHWKANLFMTTPEVNNDLKKMFNVAITRAKFKLYVVGNFSYCQKRAKNNALAELLHKLLQGENLPLIEAKKLLPNLAYAPQKELSLNPSMNSKNIICRENSFTNHLINDLTSFSHRMIIYSPFITETRLGELLPFFVDAISKGKQITVVTKSLSERSSKDCYSYEKCEKELSSVGVHILHKKGMHEKLIFVDSTAVWSGSLNALSFSGTTGEIMQRHEDNEIVKSYEKICDIEHIDEVSASNQEQKCPICGGEMIAAESSNGGIFWFCENKDYSRSANQKYPADGLLRCKCGSPYCFSMKKQPRWVCTTNPRHSQPVRESDFKLPQMAALLSKSQRKAVDQYFKEIHLKSSTTSPKKTSAKHSKKESTASQEISFEQLSMF